MSKASNIYLKFQQDKFLELINENEDYLKLKQFIKHWKDDPMHQTNNKRRAHGLPVLRKQSNRKNRFCPPKEILFQMVEDIINDILPKHMNEVFKTFVSVENIYKK